MADDPETTGGRIPDENRRIADRLSEYTALLEQQGEVAFGCVPVLKPQTVSSGCMSRWARCCGAAAWRL